MRRFTARTAARSWAKSSRPSLQLHRVEALGEQGLRLVRERCPPDGSTARCCCRRGSDRGAPPSRVTSGTPRACASRVPGGHVDARQGQAHEPGRVEQRELTAQLGLEVDGGERVTRDHLRDGAEAPDERPERPRGESEEVRAAGDAAVRLEIDQHQRCRGDGAARAGGWALERHQHGPRPKAADHEMLRHRCPPPRSSDLARSVECRPAFGAARAGESPRQGIAEWPNRAPEQARGRSAPGSRTHGLVGPSGRGRTAGRGDESRGEPWHTRRRSRAAGAARATPRAG